MKEKNREKDRILNNRLGLSETGKDRNSEYNLKSSILFTIL